MTPANRLGGALAITFSIGALVGAMIALTMVWGASVWTVAIDAFAFGLVTWALSQMPVRLAHLASTPTDQQEGKSA